MFQDMYNGRQKEACVVGGSRGGPKKDDEDYSCKEAHALCSVMFAKAKSDWSRGKDAILPHSVLPSGARTFSAKGSASFRVPQPVKREGSVTDPDFLSPLEFAAVAHLHPLICLFFALDSGDDSASAKAVDTTLGAQLCALALENSERMLLF
jgi:hypothetical protein